MRKAAEHANFQSEAEFLHSRIELAKLVRDNPVCVMADPLLVCRTNLPYIDFVQMHMHDRQRHTSYKNQQDEKPGGYR